MSWTYRRKGERTREIQKSTEKIPLSGAYRGEERKWLSGREAIRIHVPGRTVNCRRVKAESFASAGVWR